MDIHFKDLKFDRYLTATRAADIRSFSMPLLRPFDLHHFSFSRSYPDKVGYCLTTDPDFSNLFNIKKIYESAFTGKIEEYKDGYYLWEFFQGTPLGNAICEYMDIRHGITIIQNFSPLYCDFYHFGSRSAHKQFSFTGPHYFWKIH